MKTKLLKLAQIVTTAGTQIRSRIDEDTVAQYAEAMQDTGSKFPPVIVFGDGSAFILADGFHRVMAATRNGFRDIEADVRKGTRADALKYALSANTSHGLRRSNSDKRRSVELALTEWPKLSDRELARICAVGADMVGGVRREQLSENDSSATRTGADGKERKMPTRKEKPASSRVESHTPEPEPEPQTTDQKWKDAIGVSDAANFFAAQIEDVVSAVISDGSDKQKAMALKACILAVKKLTTTKPV